MRVSIQHHQRHSPAFARTAIRQACRLEALEQRTLLSGVGPPDATLDFSGGFANPAGLTVNAPAAIDGSNLLLAGGGAASAWSTTPRDITQFNTSFSFRNTNPGSPGRFAFTLQANGNTAGSGGLDHTVTLMFNPTSASQFVPPGATGMFANGISSNYFGLVNNSFSGMNFDNGDVYNVTLSYPFDNGGTQPIVQTDTDTNTGATFRFNYEAIDIPALIGGGSANVGFTGISGSYDILSCTYTSPSIGSTPFSPSFLHYAPYTDPYRVDLSWTDNSTNEDGFVVERSVEGGPWSDLATLPANAASYSDSAISFLTHYRYAVRAVNGAGSSVESNVVEARPEGHRPAAPSAATATAVSPNRVNLTWQDNNFHSGLGFRVYRKTGGVGDYALLTQLPTDNQHQIVSFADTQAPSGTLLEYHIVSAVWLSDYTHDAESAPAYISITTPPAAVDVFGPTIALNGSAAMVRSALELTDNQPIAEAGSAFSLLPQAADQFTTQFSFQIAHPDVGGLTFTMEYGNPSYLGSPRGLGYGEGPNTGGINLAVDFTLGDLGPDTPGGDPFGVGGGATGLMINGFATQGDSVDLTSSGIDLRSGHIFNVTLSNLGRINVAGSALDETIVDATTGAIFRHTYWGNLGGVLDLVGLTAGRPASSQQSVNILSWSYSNGGSPNPTVFVAHSIIPSALSLAAVGTYGGTATLTANLQANGASLGGALVSFMRADNTPLGTATTDANGIATLSNVSLAGVNAGTYANAFLTSFAGDANDTASSASGSLLVNPAPLTITVNDATKIDTQANPAFSAQYAGFVPGEGPAVLGGALVFSTAANAGSPVGTYAVSASSLTSSNYSIAYQPGTLTIIDENVQGMVWVDFNNDGNVDFGEQGLSGVSITLVNSAGALVAQTTTDANGLYTFSHVPPDVYRITEGGNPPGYVEGKDSLGLITDLQGNVISPGAGDASVQDLFSAIPIGADQNAINYNFGEQPAAGAAVTKGQAATMGFWQNKNGQALILKFTSIGNWLADTMPQTFGSLAGASPQQVAAFYQQQFVLKDKLDAQVMATALNVFATNTSLGGAQAAAYGFTVGAYGLGDSTWNIGADGAAFGVANNSTLTVMQILQDWDQDSLSLKTNKTIRQLAIDVFGGINAKGGI